MAENRRLRRELEIKQEPTSGPAARVALLHDVLAKLPEQSIPELQFATEGDWYSAADGGLESVDDYRMALSKLRTSAQGRFAAKAYLALTEYLKAHAGKFPQDPAELVSYFNPPGAADILRRYAVVPASTIKSVGVGGDWAITPRSVVDSTYDTHSVIALTGPGGTDRSCKRSLSI